MVNDLLRLRSPLALFAAISVGTLGIPIALGAAGYAAGTYLKGALPDGISGASKSVADLAYRQEHGGMPAWHRIDR